MFCHLFSKAYSSEENNAVWLYNDLKLAQIWPQTDPDLQLDPLVLPKDGLDLEVNAHCGDEGGGEWVIGVAEEEGRLAYTAVAYDENLEHVVKVLVHRIFLHLFEYIAHAIQHLFNYFLYIEHVGRLVRPELSE